MKESRRFRNLLTRWQEHCEEQHGATPSDYKRNVVAWHKRNAPNCDYRGRG